MINIALISPYENAYSETFIQQHKEYIAGNLIYYYNGFVPTKNDREGGLLTSRQRLKYKFQTKIIKSSFSLRELAFIGSLRKNKIDIVIAEYGITAAQVLNACKFLKVPLIPIFHGYDASIKEVLKQNEMSYKKLFIYSKQLIAVSQKIKSTLVSMGCSPLKIVVSPCAPCDSFFNLNPSFKSQQFLAVGRFTDKKAPYYTILAFKEVVKQYPNAILKIGGSGILYNACKNLIKYYKLENKVILLGVVSKEKVRDEMEKSIAFLQHSIAAENGDSEGTPVVILEASASGVPIVSTRHAGIPDVVLDGETGFLVEEHDVEEMTDKMLLLLSNKKLCKQLGDNGKVFVKNNYSLKQHIEVIDNVVKNILSFE